MERRNEVRKNEREMGGKRRGGKRKVRTEDRSEGENGKSGK